MMIANPVRRLIAWLGIAVIVLPLVLSVGASAAAEAALDEALDYPTVDALRDAVIPTADRIDLARRLRGVTNISAPPTTAPVRQIGERQAFWVSNADDSRTFQMEAVLRAVGEHLYVWVEDGAAIPDGQLAALTDTFDRVVYPEVRRLWGSEATPGIDGDARVYGLFARDLGGSIVAYYAGRHSFPDEVIDFSNEHEMLFFNLDNIGTDIGHPNVVSTVAHEFQHMVRANVDPNEDGWLDEGFSVFTEYFLGYEDALWTANAFTNRLDTQLNTWGYNTDNLPHYGAALLFVWYFYQRYGLEAVQALSADPANGLVAFDHVLTAMGEPDVNALFADWALANVIQDKQQADGRYGYGAALVPPRPLETVVRYPYRASRTANQYATHYVDLLAPARGQALAITLTMPETVALVPTVPYSGQHAWYSNRGDQSEMTLTRAFDLSQVREAALNYQLWYAIEEGWDYGYTMVSVDGGASWDLLQTPEMRDFNPHGNAYGWGYTGESAGWLRESVALDAYAGQPEVLVRFALITDDATLLPGMMIDDVSIPAIGYASDFEAGADGWDARGFVWTDNRLPQQAWVQAVQYVGTRVDVTRWLATDPTTTWRLPLIPGAFKVALTISPFAPVTTVPMPYTLDVSVP